MFAVHSRSLRGSQTPRGIGFLFSAVLRPVECGAYSSGVSGKQKIIKARRSLRLCGERGGNDAWGEEDEFS
jgi:hypothetical protein